MRELQNGYLVVMMLIIITVFATTTIVKSGPTEYEPLPTDYMDSPVDECVHIERYEFDTPGIDAHEVKTKKDCEEVIS